MTTYHNSHYVLRTSDCFLHHAVRSRYITRNNNKRMTYLDFQEEYCACRGQRFSKHDPSINSIDDFIPRKIVYTHF